MWKEKQMMPHEWLMERFKAGAISLLQVAKADGDYNARFNDWMEQKGISFPTTNDALDFYDVIYKERSEAE